MNPFIAYKFFIATENFKSASFKKLRKNKPMNSRGISDITLSNNRQCIGNIASYITIEAVEQSITDKEIPKCFQDSIMLMDFVSYSLYLWLDSFMVDYFLEGDLVQIANVDELNYFLRSYKKKLQRIYKKYGGECVRYLLKFDSYLNQLENDPTQKEFVKAKQMLYDDNISSTEFRDTMNQMFQERMLEKLSLEYFKHSFTKGSEYFDRNIQNGKTPKALLNLYIKFSFLNGNTSHVIKHLKESNYDLSIQYHIDEIVSRIQDLGMVTNTFIEYDGSKFVGISKVSNDDKTKIVNNLVLSRRNTDKIVDNLKQAKLDNSGYVRYSPSKVLNYIKLKKGIDSITEES